MYARSRRDVPERLSSGGRYKQSCRDEIHLSPMTPDTFDEN